MHANRSALRENAIELETDRALVGSNCQGQSPQPFLSIRAVNLKPNVSVSATRKTASNAK